MVVAAAGIPCRPENPVYVQMCELIAQTRRASTSIQSLRSSHRRNAHGPALRLGPCSTRKQEQSRSDCFAAAACFPRHSIDFFFRPDYFNTLTCIYKLTSAILQSDSRRTAVLLPLAHTTPPPTGSSPCCRAGGPAGPPLATTEWSVAAGIPPRPRRWPHRWPRPPGRPTCCWPVVCCCVRGERKEILSASNSNDLKQTRIQTNRTCR